METASQWYEHCVGFLGPSTAASQITMCSVLKLIMIPIKHWWGGKLTTTTPEATKSHCNTDFLFNTIFEKVLLTADNGLSEKITLERWKCFPCCLLSIFVFWWMKLCSDAWKPLVTSHRFSWTSKCLTYGKLITALWLQRWKQPH